MASSSSPSPSRPLNVLVVGANGYIGTAVCKAFLRASLPAPYFYRVYGLVRRESTATALAANEIIPVVGPFSDPEALSRKLLSHTPTWDVIVIATEPAKLDSAEEEQHWRDLLTLTQILAKSSTTTQGRQARPVVLWSSGCKDYGTTGLHGDEDLKPHTETSPLSPPGILIQRTNGALRAVEASLKDGGSAGFDVSIIRPTPVYGYSSSYFGTAFDYLAAYAAAAAATNGDGDERVLKIPSPEGTIMHALHVDDSADAYVALATKSIFSHGGNEPGKADRKDIAGQAFNMSSGRYETLGEIGRALAAEYGFTRVEFGVSSGELPAPLRAHNTDLVFGYSQWVGSNKIRAVTGWRDTRPLFHENIKVYRLAYEAAHAGGDENVARTKQRMAGNWGDS